MLVRCAHMVTLAISMTLVTPQTGIAEDNFDKCMSDNTDLIKCLEESGTIGNYLSNESFVGHLDIYQNSVHSRGGIWLPTPADQYLSHTK